MGRRQRRVPGRYLFPVIGLLVFSALPLQQGQAQSVTESQNNLVLWQAGIVSRLTDSRRYPPQARADHEEGIVLVSFALDRQGHVLTPRLARTSGHPLLDQEALAMLKRVGALPPPPSSVTQDPVFLTLPVMFCLNTKNCPKS